MAAFTKPSAAEVEALLRSLGIEKIDVMLPLAAGSVNSNFRLRAGSRTLFLRIYEEQDARGARAELAMVSALAERGVPTPRALGAGTLAGKPAAVFPWVEGDMVCQRAVSGEHARAVGQALARVHLAGAGVDAPAHRFGPAALRERLARIDPALYPSARLGRALDELEAAREAVPEGLAHGDLFRDNVLWAPRSRRVAALLDFESAFRGPLVYDLAVTVLAWCFGDSFERELASALASGYASVRPLEASEQRALHVEARLAAVRFAVTRITDYAMKGGQDRVMKDWRRFVARLDALEAMGAEGLRALVGLT